MISIDYNKIYNSNQYGKMKILKYLGKKNGKDYVEVQFLDSGNIREARYEAVLRGEVRDLIYENIDTDMIRHSNYYGDYKILSVSPGTSISNRRAVVQFIDTGYSYETTLYAALNGTVRDALYGIDYNKIYYSNINGPFRIIQYIGMVNHHSRVLIQFIYTGTIKDVQLQNALDGKVGDPAQKLRIPINSSLPIDNYQHRVDIAVKSMWRTMMDRCYNEKNPMYKFYGAIGIHVDDSWHDFDTFEKDIKTIDGYIDFYNNPYSYNLDKDYLQLDIPKQFRVYSKNTCCFLSWNDNKNLSAIEYRNNNLDKLESKYFGVTTNKIGNYSCGININGTYFYIGTFNNEIAAANAYNYWFEYFHSYNKIPLRNDVPYMPPSEFIKYNVKTKEMCSIKDN